MEILFWNLLNGNPIDACVDAKGGGIQGAVLGFDCDLMIFCEVLDLAIDHTEIETLKLVQVVQTEAKNLNAQLQQPVAPPLDQRITKGISHLQHSVSDRRSGHVFGCQNEGLRADAHAMAQITAAVTTMEQTNVLDNAINLMAQPTISSKLDRVKLAPIVKAYPYWEALDADQSNRNYLIFSKSRFTLTQVPVQIDSAKRNIMRIEVNGRVVYAVHAPAFAKGGAETVVQLGTLLLREQRPAIAIGDMNIDMEELFTELERETPSNASHRNFLTSNGLQLQGPPEGKKETPYQRQWHRNRGFIQKKVPRTQKSGGTLDYVVAPARQDVVVQIAVAPEVHSDHAAIVATWHA